MHVCYRLQNLKSHTQPWSFMVLKTSSQSSLLMLLSSLFASAAEGPFSESPSFICDLLFLLPILSEYFAKAADRADLIDNSGSFFFLLFAAPISFSTSCSPVAELGLKLMWIWVSWFKGWVGTTRLNGSWKVSYKRFTWTFSMLPLNTQWKSNWISWNPQ